MKTYFALFVISTCCALVITPLIRRFCQRFNLLDVPNDERRVHTSAVPRLGGIAIYISLMVALASLLLVSNLVTDALSYYRPLFFKVLVPSSLVLLLGIYDDLRGANAADPQPGDHGERERQDRDEGRSGGDPPGGRAREVHGPA